MSRVMLNNMCVGSCLFVSDLLQLVKNAISPNTSNADLIKQSYNLVVRHLPLHPAS